MRAEIRDGVTQLKAYKCHKLLVNHQKLRDRQGQILPQKEPLCGHFNLGFRLPEL